jgi:hypothetical protein
VRCVCLEPTHNHQDGPKKLLHRCLQLSRPLSREEQVVADRLHADKEARRPAPSLCGAYGRFVVTVSSAAPLCFAVTQCKFRDASIQILSINGVDLASTSLSQNEHVHAALHYSGSQSCCCCSGGSGCCWTCCSVEGPPRNPKLLPSNMSQMLAHTCSRC